MSLAVAVASIDFRQMTGFGGEPATGTGMKVVVYCSCGLPAAWMSQLTGMG